MSHEFHHMICTKYTPYTASYPPVIVTYIINSHISKVAGTGGCTSSQGVYGLLALLSSVKHPSSSLATSQLMSDGDSWQVAGLQGNQHCWHQNVRSCFIYRPWIIPIPHAGLSDVVQAVVMDEEALAASSQYDQKMVEKNKLYDVSFSVLQCWNGQSQEASCGEKLVGWAWIR